uniref:Uncharacterized protein n=1 Tax=Sesuvium portulacastrum TaxID=221166 RepID=A0A6B9MB78_SESPO|nr:uncharacterized protein [Sesuvium portulacastrum]
MPALRFKTCRLLSGNVRKRELTKIQRRILRKLRKKKIYIKKKIFPRKNRNNYIQLQTTRKLPLFHGNLPITKMHRGTKQTSYIPFLLNPETRLDAIPVRLHFCETIPQARQPRKRFLLVFVTIGLCLLLSIHPFLSLRILVRMGFRILLGPGNLFTGGFLILGSWTSGCFHFNSNSEAGSIVSGSRSQWESFDIAVIDEWRQAPSASPQGDNEQLPPQDEEVDQPHPAWSNFVDENSAEYKWAERQEFLCQRWEKKIVDRVLELLPLRGTNLPNGDQKDIAKAMDFFFTDSQQEEYSQRMRFLKSTYSSIIKPRSRRWDEIVQAISEYLL